MVCGPCLISVSVVLISHWSWYKLVQLRFNSRDFLTNEACNVVHKYGLLDTLWRIHCGPN
jgi:hypothetical protein